MRLLWPELWDFVGDDARHGFGTRYGRFQASAETEPAAAARELLDLVDGAAYLPEQIRVVEIDKVIDLLESAHEGWNNFYNESAPAEELESLIGSQGHVPAALSRKYVSVVVNCFLGNGHGVSSAALSHYVSLLGFLDPGQAGRALRAFTDPAVSSLLRTSTGGRQWEALLDILEPKLTLRSDRALYEAVRAFTGTPDQLRADSNIARLAESGVAHARRSRRG